VRWSPRGFIQNLIDPLARKLKDAGYGVMVAGVRVALLMYADDIVLLSDSQDELMR
jgi:hypothetical protein